MLPKISIIVPTYNREQTITECINSILQSEFHDFEIIIIDDGSTDETSQICKRMADSDSRIRYVYQHNGGVSAARNHGLKLCQGEWVTFVDSDDRITPFHLSVVALAGNTDLLVTDFAHPEVETDANCKDPYPVKSDNAAEYLFNEYNPYKKPIFSVCNKFFRSEILRQRKISFNEDLSLGEDRLLVSNYLIYAKRLIYFRQKSYIEMRREGANSLVKTLRTPKDYMKTFRLNYQAMHRLSYKSKSIMKYATDYAISQPIVWILYQYTENKKCKLLQHGELIKFTKDEIIPFISTIDTSIYNAKHRRDRTVRWMLLHAGAKFTIDFCRLWNKARSCMTRLKHTDKKTTDME